MTARTATIDHATRIRQLTELNEWAKRQTQNLIALKSEVRALKQQLEARQ